MKIGPDHGEHESDHQEDQQLPFQLALQHIERNDHHPHQVRKNEPKAHEIPDPPDYLYNFAAGIELVEGIGKEDADQGKTAPAYCLEDPVS